MNHWINIFDGLLLTQKMISGRIQKRSHIFRENGCPKRLMIQLNKPWVVDEQFIESITQQQPFTIKVQNKENVTP